MLKLYGSPTGPGSSEGPRGDNREDKSGKTRHGPGACLHLALFFSFGELFSVSDSCCFKTKLVFLSVKCKMRNFTLI